MTMIRRVRHGEEISRVILPARRRPLAPQALAAKLEPLVADWLAAVSDWEGLGLGESRCLVFETDIGPDVTFFVRFWSEAKAPLLCEVPSGREDAALAAFLPADAEAWMEARGFAIHGERQNYRGHIPTDNPEDVAAAAAFAVATLVAMVGYQGLTPLWALLAHDTRAQLHYTLDSFTEEEVARVFMAEGFRVTWIDPEAVEPVFLCRKSGTDSLVRLMDQAPGTRLYRRVHFSAELPVNDAAVRIAVEQGDSPEPGDSMVSISGFHAFTGGVTLDWLSERVREWDRALAEHRREMRRARKDKRRGPAAPPSETIH